MPTINDLVGDPDFWKFPEDRRAYMAKKVDPDFGQFPDDRINVMLGKIRDSRPNSQAKGDSAPAQVTSRAFEPPFSAQFKVTPDKGVEVGYGITPEGRKNVAQAFRIATMASTLIPGSAVTRGAIGAAGEAVTETGEMFAGDREKYNPLAIGLAGAEAAFIPGVKGAMTRDVVKGAVHGIGSFTLNKWARGESALDAPGWAAISTLTGALGAGLGSRFYKGSVHELMPRKEGELATDILEGRIPKELQKTWVGGAEAVEEVKSIRKATMRMRKDLPKSSIDYLRRPQSFVLTEAKAPEIEIASPTDPLPDIDSNYKLMGRARRTKDVMSHLQDKTGIPFFDAYTKVRGKLGDAAQKMSSAGDSLHGIFRKVRYDRRQSMQALLEANPANRDKIALILGLGRDDIRKAEELESLLKDRFAEWGLDSKKFYQDVLPKVRAKGSLEAAYPTGHMPKEAQFFKDDFTSEMIGPKDRDSLGLAIRLLKSGTHRSMVEPEIEQAKKLLHQPLRSSVSEPFENYLNVAGGKHRDFANVVADVYHKVATAIPGVDMTKRDARYIVDTIASLQYTSTLAFRAGPLIRNTLQGIQTAYPVMGNWYFKGVRQAFTKEGRRIVEENGVLAGDPQYRETLRAAEGMTERGALQTVAKGLNKIQSVGMKRYGQVDDTHIASVYLGQRAKVLDAVRRSKTVDQIIDRADLDRFLPTEVSKWKLMLENGQHVKVADEAGKALAYDTQWSNMLAGDKPQIIQGFGGRTLGGFSNWALQYGDYMRRNVFGNGPWQKKAVWFSRWAAVNTAMATATGAAAYHLGYEHPLASALSNTFITPAVPTGGPHLQLALSTANAAVEQLSGGGMGRQTKQWVGNMEAAFVPFYQAGKSDFPDFVKILNDEDPAPLLHLIGMAPRTWGERKK